MRDWLLVAVILVAAVLAHMVAGCSRTPPPEKPAQPEIHDDLHCFVFDTVNGAGVVCTAKAGVCAVLQVGANAADARRKGVTAVSECLEATVTVDAK